jgi:hypothetical protein
MGAHVQAIGDKAILLEIGVRGGGKLLAECRDVACFAISGLMR